MSKRMRERELNKKKERKNISHLVTGSSLAPNRSSVRFFYDDSFFSFRLYFVVFCSIRYCSFALFPLSPSLLFSIFSQLMIMIVKVQQFPIHCIWCGVCVLIIFLPNVLRISQSHSILFCVLCLHMFFLCCCVFFLSLFRLHFIDTPFCLPVHVYLHAHQSG